MASVSGGQRTEQEDPSEAACHPGSLCSRGSGIVGVPQVKEVPEASQEDGAPWKAF